ncbi:hypothetical protein FCV25MIE_00419, partial [Fagus crenata]
MKDLLLPSQSVEELIARTESISCADNRLSLSPSKDPLNTTELSLIGKIIYPRNFINSVVKEIIMKAWKPTHEIQVKRVERNTFLFSFGHEVDRQLAFNRRPWTIKGAHLILKIWSPELSWQEIVFSSSTFWIQIHGLPRLWQNKDNLIQIGQQAGKIDIYSPLKPGIFLPRSGLPDLWIGLKYEKISDLCYRCGIIGHAEKECSNERVFLSNQHGVKFPAFGEWIRSDNDKEPPKLYESSSAAEPPDLASNSNADSEHIPTTVVGPTMEGNVDCDHEQVNSCLQGEISSFAKLLAVSLQNECSAQRTCMEHKDYLECQSLGVFSNPCLSVCEPRSVSKWSEPALNDKINSPKLLTQDGPILPQLPLLQIGPANYCTIPDKALNQNPAQYSTTLDKALNKIQKQLPTS